MRSSKEARRPQASKRPWAFVPFFFLLLVMTSATAQSAAPAGKARAQKAAKSAAPPAASASFSGQRAFDQTKALVAIGPRPVGSAEHDKTVQYITEQLAELGLKPEVNRFNWPTPLGQKTFQNLIVKFKGQTDRAVLVGGHYDTKLFTDFRFVGANDGGSSAGLLLELARVLKNSPPRKLGVWLVFLDGEEAFREWSDTDSRYGSRHYAQLLRSSGDSRKLDAFVLVDMIGDKNLDLMRDLNSTGWLNEMVRDVAAKLNLAKVCSDDSMAIEDDHLPFAQIGLPVVDLIDFTYGPGKSNPYWHNAQDTMDKLSAKSFDAVGRIVLGTIDAIGRRN